MKLPAARIIELLGLEPLPAEGGHFRQVYRDANSTAIYFLVQPDEFSAIHQLSGPEVYHFYGGDPLRMLLLHPDGRIERPVLGMDLEGGMRPLLVVPGGVWQGSETTGDWTLVGTTMAPGFRPSDFELARRADLVAAYPEAAAEIARLTRR
jgi:predicted cupin superfamily sugar epimerase